MKFKKDQIWKSRDGHIVIINNINNEIIYNVEAKVLNTDFNNINFTSDGFFFDKMDNTCNLNDIDLVELIGDIETHPEYFL